MDWIKRFFGRKPSKIQTFTYYIPAPPPRKTGYREKEFDKLFYQFINRGFEILWFKAVPHSGANHSGMWVIFAVRALTVEAETLDLEDFSGLEVSEVAETELPESEKTIDLPTLDASELTDQVEGLYPLDQKPRSGAR
jgi:hypothetical protein